MGDWGSVIQGWWDAVGELPVEYMPTTWDPEHSCMFFQSTGFLLYSEIVLELLWPVFLGSPAVLHSEDADHGVIPPVRRKDCDWGTVAVVFYLFVGVVCAFVHDRDQRVKGTFWVTAQLQSTGRMVVCSVGDFFPSTSCSDCPVALMLTVNFQVRPKSYNQSKHGLFSFYMSNYS